MNGDSDLTHRSSTPPCAAWTEDPEAKPNPANGEIGRARNSRNEPCGRRQGPARRHPGWRRRERCGKTAAVAAPPPDRVDGPTFAPAACHEFRIPYSRSRARRPRGATTAPNGIRRRTRRRSTGRRRPGRRLEPGGGTRFGRRPDAAAAPSAGGPWRDGHVSPLRDGRGDLQGYAWTCGRRGRVTETDDARRRVLVVEDNHDSAESLALLLRAWGHDVRTAHDGLRAIEIAREFIPEVVLLDIGLPTVSGYEVAVWLRGMPAMDKALLVAVTAYGQEEDRRRTRQTGFDAHLVKPAAPEALNALLGQSRAGR